MFFALQKYYNTFVMKEEDMQDQDEVKSARSSMFRNKGGGGKFMPEGKALGNEDAYLTEVFNKMVNEYDFMNVVMYPNLKNRREFVHDAWVIAKATENEELKMAISKDPYFYLTRRDLLMLLKTKDDQMIKHLLSTDCQLLIQDDASFKLVGVKHAQVDKNLMTPIRMLDFISVLVENKRVNQYDLDSVILFSHNYILNFLQTHQAFVNPVEVIKIFILARRFRLSLQFIQDSHVPFQIDFFINAIESNSYDIAFYLLKVYEDQINQNYQRAIDAHVDSYRRNNKFLKAKLHMSKMLLGIFNFNAAKVFLEIINNSINDASLEGNFFSHSSNPLLSMCCLYELLTNIIKKFFSLSNLSRELMGKTMSMAIDYIESVDDENFLTTVMLEKDYTGRDSLRIAVELELLEMIQAPKVEAIIKRIYYSDYDQSGNLFQMSTSYQILFANKN